MLKILFVCFNVEICLGFVYYEFYNRGFLRFFKYFFVYEKYDLIKEVF